mmetsp:Transcript_18890/g.60213  ORF Transcript_18890/g.60213 Transcript_18890/m.60213 type:complete len:240 (-) Transcript_18890:504-1223(-)
MGAAMVIGTSKDKFHTPRSFAASSGRGRTSNTSAKSMAAKHPQPMPKMKPRMGSRKKVRWKASTTSTETMIMPAKYTKTFLLSPNRREYQPQTNGLTKALNSRGAAAYPSAVSGVMSFGRSITFLMYRSKNSCTVYSPSCTIMRVMNTQRKSWLRNGCSTSWASERSDQWCPPRPRCLGCKRAAAAERTGVDERPGTGEPMVTPMGCIRCGVDPEEEDEAGVVSEEGAAESSSAVAVSE